MTKERQFPRLVTFSGNDVIVGGFSFKCTDKREAYKTIRHYLLKEFKYLHDYDTEEDSQQQLENIVKALKD